MKQHDGSWLRLLLFFTVTTLASSLALAAVLAGFTAAFAGNEPPQDPVDQPVDPVVPGQAFSGVVTDSRCGARHTSSQQNASECVRMCVRDGSRYIIVDGDKNYKLAGNLVQVSQLAGQRVNVTGVLNGDTINVSSASLQAEDGEQR